MFTLINYKASSLPGLLFDKAEDDVPKAFSHVMAPNCNNNNNVSNTSK